MSRGIQIGISEIRAARRSDVAVVLGLAHALGIKVYDGGKDAGYLLVGNRWDVVVPKNGMRDGKRKSLLRGVSRHGDLGSIKELTALDGPEPMYVFELWKFIDRYRLTQGYAIEAIIALGSVHQTVDQWYVRFTQHDGPGIDTRPWHTVGDLAKGRHDPALGRVPTPTEDKVTEVAIAAMIEVHDAQPENKVVASDTDPVVIDRKRWWASKGEDQGYLSDAVDVITYSDGTVAYGCRREGCDRTFDNPKSASVHYGAHDRGKGRKPIPPVTLPHNPDTPYVARPEAERVPNPHGPGEMIPLTVDDVIDSITSMVRRLVQDDTQELRSLNNMYAAEIVQLRDKVKELEERCAVVTEQWEGAVNRANDLENSLTTLRDLISETVNKVQ